MKISTAVDKRDVLLYHKLVIRSNLGKCDTAFAEPNTGACRECIITSRRFLAAAFFKVLVILVPILFFANSYCFGREQPKPSLTGVSTYANSYGNYNARTLSKFLKFDAVVIEPYDVPNINFLKKLKKNGVIIFAYISVGEAGPNRRYFKNWRSYGNTPDNPDIPRSKVVSGDPVFIDEDPGWPGSFYADTSSPRWHRIILEEEIPYVLWLGKGLYDGLFLDVIDAADVYASRKNGLNMIDGMVKLVKKIREKYPEKLIMANRGFTILKDIAPYIDAMKFEEYTSAYGNIRGGERYGEYYVNFDEKGRRTNENDVKALEAALKINPSIKVFILDHVNTSPPDRRTARLCFHEAVRLSERLGQKVLWYANSVHQDLPVWPDFDKRIHGGGR